jgi:hypothetical protein
MQVSLPASFMPVDSLPMVTAVDSGKGTSRPPASLPSITSFASALSCNTELVSTCTQARNAADVAALLNPRSARRKVPQVSSL